MDKILKRNFSYLFILQNANYIIPLLLLPYLAQTLGAENFGKIAFAQAYISYFILLTDFGFNTSSTQTIAKVQNDRIAVSRIYWNTISAKFVFALISFIVLIVTIYLFPKLNSKSALLYTSSIGIISSVLFPIWLFQGIEKMAIITYLSIIPRILVLVGTFKFVKSREDYLLALQIQIAGTLIMALMGSFVVLQKKYVVFIKPNFKGILNEVYGSWHIFVSTFATSIYTTTNVVVLGFLTNDAIVGLFSASDKIIKAIIAMSSSLTQVTFPRINVYYLESIEKARLFARRLLRIVTGINFLGAVTLFILAPFIVKLLFGIPEYQETIIILRISCLLPMFAIANGIIAVNVFITFNLKKSLVQVIGSGGLFSILMVIPLTYLFKAEGVAICALVTELLISILFIKKLTIFKIDLLR
jgi:polysaccharide transporter, PST family